jgi:hypothetical protein
VRVTGKSLLETRNERTVPKTHSEPDVWKGALAGLVAGLIASWAMDRFQDVWVAFSSMKAWFLCLDSRRAQASTRFRPTSTRQLRILFSEQRRKESDEYCAGNEVLTAHEKK